MEIAVWIVSAIVALAFIFAGGMKSLRPMAALADMMPWTVTFGAPLVRSIGIVEVLGGIGVILPVLTGIAPILTPIAATGLVAAMIGAMILHARRGEYGGLVPNFVLLALAAFVAIARFAGV
jgi:uncharacterized membrane protein